MKIIVSGANGQLGSELLKLSKDVSGIEFHFFGSKEFDITDSKALNAKVELIQPNYFINCAAYTAVDQAEDDKENAFNVNANAVDHIAKACVKCSCTLIHVSTDYVFDGLNTRPYLPNEKTDPIGVYGSSKLLGENNIKNSNCNALVLRTAWVFSSFGKNFVKTMLRLGADRSELSVVNDQIGSPTYAYDLAKAILKIVDEQYVPKGLVIHHFTNEGVCSWAEFANEIMRQANLECEIKGITTDQYPTKAKRPAYSVLSLDSFKSTFPAVEIRNWQEALKACLSTLN